MQTIDTGSGITVYDAGAQRTMGEAMDDYMELVGNIESLAASLADSDDGTAALQLIADAIAVAHLMGEVDLHTTVLGILWTMFPHGGRFDQLSNVEN